ncbi:MAG: hypothetical protein AAF497_18790 [Planctomycetota bacterium]
MNVTSGTDTYGRVKTVGGTPIVTKFAMFESIPLYPLRSYYFISHGETRTRSVPFLSTTEEVEVNGIPLAVVDRTSVTMAYLRGLFSIMILFGCISMVPIMMHFSGTRLDQLAQLFTGILLGSLAIGIIGGSLTYLVPTPKREEKIREYCGYAIGICVDPARVTVDRAIAIGEQFATLGGLESRNSAIAELVVCRARIAEGNNVSALETRTDELLARIEKLAQQ